MSRGKVRRALVGIAIVLALSLALVSTGVAYTPPCPHADRDPIPPPPGLKVGPQVGQIAPDFTLPVLGEADEVTLSQVRGCVVLLEFWASWCTYCRESSSYLEQLALRYHDQGLVVLGVSLDRLPEAARAFVAAVGLSEVVPLWGSFEEALAVARAYRVAAIPHVFLIDRRGVIRYAGHPAGLTPDLIEYWLAVREPG